MKLTLEQLQAEGWKWVQHNFPKGKHYHPLLGVVEEVRELAHAHLKIEQNIRGCNKADKLVATVGQGISCNFYPLLRGDSRHTIRRLKVPSDMFLKRSDFIVFYGNIGSGKTLGAVGYIKDCNFKNLVSNVTLNEIKYMPFRRRSFLRYKNKVVFLDMVDFYSDMTSQRNRNRQEKLAAERMAKFLTMAINLL